MVEDRIGYRYAKSVFGLAEEKKMLDKVQADMETISAVCKASPDLVAMLNSPLISMGKKENIVTAVFEKLFTSELAPLLTQMLVRKGREMYLPHVANSFIQLYDESKGVERGTLVSAHKLSSKEEKAIQAAMEEKIGKKLELTVEVDPELIGGFVLKVGDKLFDGSVSSSLRRIKQELTKR